MALLNDLVKVAGFTPLAVASNGLGNFNGSSGDGKYFCQGSQSTPYIKAWRLDSASATPVAQTFSGKTITSEQWPQLNGDGTYLVSRWGGNLDLWKRTGNDFAFVHNIPMAGGADGIMDIGGDVVVTLDSTTLRSYTINRTTDQLVPTGSLGGSNAYVMTISPDHSVCAVIPSNLVGVIFYSLPSWSIITDLSVGSPNNIGGSWSPDGKYFIAGNYFFGTGIRVYKNTSGVYSLNQTINNGSQCISVMFLNNGNNIIGPAYSAGPTTFWSVNSAADVFTLVSNPPSYVTEQHFGCNGNDAGNLIVLTAGTTGMQAYAMPKDATNVTSAIVLPGLQAAGSADVRLGVRSTIILPRLQTASVVNFVLPTTTTVVFSPLKLEAEVDPIEDVLFEGVIFGANSGIIMLENDDYTVFSTPVPDYSYLYSSSTSTLPRLTFDGLTYQPYFIEAESTLPTLDFEGDLDQPQNVNADLFLPGLVGKGEVDLPESASVGVFTLPELQSEGIGFVPFGAKLEATLPFLESGSEATIYYAIKTGPTLPELETDGLITFIMRVEGDALLPELEFAGQILRMDNPEGVADLILPELETAVDILMPFGAGMDAVLPELIFDGEMKRRWRVVTSAILPALKVDGLLGRRNRVLANLRLSGPVAEGRGGQPFYTQDADFDLPRLVVIGESDLSYRIDQNLDLQQLETAALAKMTMNTEGSLVLSELLVESEVYANYSVNIELPLASLTVEANIGLLYYVLPSDIQLSAVRAASNVDGGQGGRYTIFWISDI